MTETANRITANILRIINTHPGCVAYRINNVGVWDEAKQVHRGGNTQKGIPDIMGSLRGRFIGIEVKAGKDRQSAEQKIVQFEIERANGVYLLIHSTDEFLSELNKLL